MKAVGARPRRRPLVVGCAALVFAALVAGAATGAPVTSSAVTPVSVTVGIIPIANTYPLDLGIKKGYFAQQGIDVKKVTLAAATTSCSPWRTTTSTSASPGGYPR